VTTLDLVALGLAGLGTGVTVTLFAIHRLRRRPWNQLRSGF
jgi:hypothetical protein